MLHTEGRETSRSSQALKPTPGEISLVSPDLEDGEDKRRRRRTLRSKGGLGREMRAIGRGCCPGGGFLQSGGEATARLCAEECVCTGSETSPAGSP